MKKANLYEVNETIRSFKGEMQGFLIIVCLIMAIQLGVSLGIAMSM